MNRLFFWIGMAGLLTLGACETPYTQGRRLYEFHCANCHMDDGTGLSGVIPPLAQADFVRDSMQRLPCIIRKGMQGPVTVNGRTYNQFMPGNPELTSAEIANIINYINSAWGNDYGYMKISDIERVLEDCP